jgi:Uroporphyrinogen-III methylase
MGLHNLPRIAAELIQGGRPAETPVAVIQQGTVSGQRCLKATLATVADRTRDEALASPSIVVVGDVVAEQMIEACAPQPAAVTMPIPF